MKNSFKFYVLVFIFFVLSGCVTSRYQDDKGRECTRHYFTPFGILWHSCAEKTEAVAAPGSSVTVRKPKIQPPQVPSPTEIVQIPVKTVQAAAAPVQAPAESVLALNPAIETTEKSSSSGKKIRSISAEEVMGKTQSASTDSQVSKAVQK